MDRSRSTQLNFPFDHKNSAKDHSLRPSWTSRAEDPAEPPSSLEFGAFACREIEIDAAIWDICGLLKRD